MERLNLNVPMETRSALKRMAGERKLREAEVARELLVDAVARAEREETYRAAAIAARDPALKTLLRQVTSAVDKVRAGSR